MAAKNTSPLTFDEFKKTRKRLKDVNHEYKSRLSKSEKLGLLITEWVGTIGFFLIITVWTIFWLGWNLLAPLQYQFDAPMGFVFWLFISNLLQILLMPLIMVGQNVQAKHAEAKTDHDLQINIKAEKEIEIILEHLDCQNTILVAMVKKMGLNLEDILKRTEH